MIPFTDANDITAKVQVYDGCELTESEHAAEVFNALPWSDREEQVGRRGAGYRPNVHDAGVRIRPEFHARSNP